MASEADALISGASSRRKKSKDETNDGLYTDIITLEEAYVLVGHGWAQYRVAIICGLCFMSDSIEVGMLSFLQVKAADEFYLSSAEESTLTSCVFAGELVGALLWGPIADKYGRFRASVLIGLFVALMGIASAFSINFIMLITLRALTGVGIGGLSVPFDILAEFVQPKYRGRMLMFVEYFWSLGTILVTGLAWLVLEGWGWRWFVGFCSIPVVLALVGFIYLPESPHWLISQGREREAFAVLQRTAEINGRPAALTGVSRVLLGEAVLKPKPQPKPRWSGATDTDGYLSVGEPIPTTFESNRWDDPVAAASDTSGPVGLAVEPSSACRVFERGIRSTTAAMFLVWTLFGFSYYGVVLILPEVLSETGTASNFNYEAMFISSLAEVFACTIAFILIDRVGRTKLSGLAYIGCGVFLGLLAYPVLPTSFNVPLTMAARGFIFIASSTTWVMTPELFPTYVRGAAHSWCNAAGRIGAAATPYWGNEQSLDQWVRLSFYAGTAALSGLTSLTLRETRGAALPSGKASYNA